MCHTVCYHSHVCHFEEKYSAFCFRCPLVSAAGTEKKWHRQMREIPPCVSLTAYALKVFWWLTLQISRAAVQIPLLGGFGGWKCNSSYFSPAANNSHLVVKATSSHKPWRDPSPAMVSHHWVKLWSWTVKHLSWVRWRGYQFKLKEQQTWAKLN